MNPLKQLEACGQAPWLDYLRRDLIASGELKTMMMRDGLKGVTSNPSIFEKAIGGSEEYAEAAKAFAAQGQPSVTAIYEHLAIADIRAAADVLRTVYDATNGRDGYVSLECSPYLANDTWATIVEARRLWTAVDRPNLMVKVPATPAGIPAIARLIEDGININVTLLFAIEAYEHVADAYITGLEARAAKGEDIGRVASVASFFVSRIDTAVDKALDELPEKAVAERLKSKVAIANAKLAYQRYRALFSAQRWTDLEQAGAQTQRLLWASTSVKSKTLKDTLYAEALVGLDTVDTLPPATMDALRDHGEVVENAIEQDVGEAAAILDALSRTGISLKAITDALVVDGVQQFADAFDKLFATIQSRRLAGAGQDLASRIDGGGDAFGDALAAAMDSWRKEGRIRRLWAGDAGLWTGDDEGQWTGWLGAVEEGLKDIDALEAFAQGVRGDGFTDVVLLGMGGSSLGPEVLAEVYGPQAGWPRFHMLDSTDPAQVKDVEQAVDLARTLIIVSSKSGGTLEPNIFADYFLDRIGQAVGADKLGSHVVAVTDPGSSLEARAKAGGWRRIFYGEPSIGGRYSVLSVFGLVPAAAIGVDVRRLLEATRPMVTACGADVPPEQNPGIQLGLALGVAATRFGRDKVTILASPALAPIGAWMEQLLAESTGKEGKGLVPVADEPLGPPGVYGTDRFFAHITLAGAADAGQATMVEALAQAGHPVARLSLKDVDAIGAEFFRWEMAVAVAGAVIGIDPFDQPDVEASKDRTRELTRQYEETQSLPALEPVFEQDGVAVYADARNAGEIGRHNTLEGYLRGHLQRLGAGDYAAFLAYADRTPAHIEALTEMRSFVRDQTRAATCVGFGPRFQHSTGQAYKGGPNSGVFLQITCDDPADLGVPGHRYSFGVVKAAQARGDLEVLEDRGRRALRVHLKDIDADLPELVRAVHSALD